MNISRLKKFYVKFRSKLSGPKDERPHSLGCLNTAQFLAALNDNFFKLVMAFLLIDTLGKEHASSILSAAGAIFVIPFLLFSSAAGVLADQFSKQRLLVLMKVAEMVIMFLAIFAFAYRSELACYSLLFFLAMHSALFGPSKYGIIPELVPSNQVSRANGLITSFTYLAIIVGTFLASFITEISHRNFPLIAGFALLVAIAGFISTFGIKKTPPQGSRKKINPFFVREIYYTLVSVKDRKHLLLAIAGTSFFLFIGAFTQLNIIPFAIEALHLSEIDGGYLFLATALGIALGAFLAGRASKTQIELGLTCLSGLALAALLLLLAFFHHHLATVVIYLILLGVFGGAFIVPCDTFIQMYSPSEKRGQVIAAANFFSFVGVLLASLALYLFSNVLGISSAKGFGIIGIATLLFSFILFTRLSDLAFHYLSKKLLFPLYKVKGIGIELIEKSSAPILIFEHANWRDALLLTGLIPNLHFLVPQQDKRRFPWVNWLFYSAHVIHTERAFEEKGKEIIETHGVPCLFIDRPLPADFPMPSTFSLKEFFTRSAPQLLFVKVEKVIGKGTIVTLSKR